LGGGGSGSRPGSGLIFARIAFKVLIRGDQKIAVAVDDMV
jgi:hypothetical protein